MMDLKKYEKIILCCALALGIFCLGFFIGRDTGENEIIITTSGDTAASDNTITDASDENTPVPSPVEPNVSTQTQVNSKLNINTATSEDLQALPGIGEVLAERIINYRTENGDFQSVDDLLKVSGIGNTKLSNIKPYITT